MNDDLGARQAPILQGADEKQVCQSQAVSLPAQQIIVLPLMQARPLQPSLLPPGQTVHMDSAHQHTLTGALLYVQHPLQRALVMEVTAAGAPAAHYRQA